VKGKQGEYHEALFNKNNRVEIVLHENLGGGFSPPAAQKRCGATAARPKAKDHGVDRTPYQGDRKISYVSYHTRAISMGITKAELRTLIDAAHHANKGPPLPHARRRPSRARLSERRPRTHVPLTVAI
jgi:hypothetical protein